MQYVCVDIEADGPIPGDFSMIELGASVVTKEAGVWTPNKWTFIAQLQPISKSYSQDALDAIGRTRTETLAYPWPWTAMENFDHWVRDIKHHDNIRFVSDNAGFDWMFVCWYFHHYIHDNPFGFSCDSLTSIYKGHKRRMNASFQRDGLRGKNPHTHNALDDAKGNAHALCTILNSWN